MVATHNPEVAGSNPAPLLERPWTRGLSVSGVEIGCANCCPTFARGEDAGLCSGDKALVHPSCRMRFEEIDRAL
jgi:hypothetical protein